MAEDFTYTITTDVGEVRSYLGDTKPDAAWFSDTELQHFVDQEGSTIKAAVRALRILLVDRARRARSYTSQAAGVSYDDTAQVQAIQDAIAQLGGGSTITYPVASISMPAPLPMDEAFDVNDP
jgi:hypothetical protein